MNVFEFVAAIIFIVTIGSVLKARYSGGTSRREDWRTRGESFAAEKERHGVDVRELKERVAVLERIVTDRGSSLAQEIDRLREPHN